jgi:hypothetical protein
MNQVTAKAGEIHWENNPPLQFTISVEFLKKSNTKKVHMAQKVAP